MVLFWGLVIIYPIIESKKSKDNLTCCEITSFLFKTIKIMFKILKINILKWCKIFKIWKTEIIENKMKL
jgi:hypothetical protein